jgi:hypothetical protein
MTFFTVPSPYCMHNALAYLLDIVSEHLVQKR